MLSFYLLICAVISYLVGNINPAIIISKLQKKDIRKMGSGNPGTLNMSRNFGLKFGLLTFFLDIMKGALPTLISYFAFGNETFPNANFIVSDFAIYLSGLCVVLGHIYPVAFKFKGGKGIASTIGVMLVCESVHGVGWSMVAVMALVCAAVFIYITEFGAMGSLIAITPPVISGSVRIFLTYKVFNDAGTITFKVVTQLVILAICFFTWFAHRNNIERMLAGEEHPTSIKGMVVKAKLKKLEEKNKTFADENSATKGEKETVNSVKNNKES